MAVDVQALLRDKKLWAVAAAGGGLGLYAAYRRRQAGGAGAAATAAGPGIQPAELDSAGYSAYQNLQAELENLQGQVTALGTVLPTAQQAVAPTPGTPPAKPPNRLELHRIGRVGGRYLLRDVARRFSRSKAPDAVEAELRAIIAANPSLRGKTTVPGGFPLKVPVR